MANIPSAQRLADAAELLGAVAERFDDEDEAAAVLGAMLDGCAVGDWPDAEEWISENYAGSGDTLADWCAEFMEETGGLEAMPEHLRNYFDFESYARDMRLGGDISEARVGGKVLVFWNR